MYCFEKQEFFCAKCDFKPHNQSHSKCEGDSNKDITEMKDTALKAVTTY